MAPDELDDTVIDPRADASPAQPSLTALLARTDLPESSVVEALVALSYRLPEKDAATPVDERERVWGLLLAEFATLNGHQRYVGSLGVAVRSAARHAEALSPIDRRVAATVILERTVAAAQTASQLRDGIAAASSISPDAVDPKRVIDSVLRPALRHSHEDHGHDRVGFALRITLEMLGSSRTPSISYQDLWALRAGLSAMVEDLDDLRGLVDRLPPVDRRQVAALLPTPAGRRRRWRGR